MRIISRLLFALGLVSTLSCGGREQTGPETGSLVITISGLPVGAAGAVAVTGPDSFSRIVGSTQTLDALVPGDYTVAAADVSVSGQTYAPTQTARFVTVVAGPTPAEAGVTYALAAGRLMVTISGLPNGTPASVTVTGPGGFTETLAATATLTDLSPGRYTLAAAAVTVGDDTYIPSPETHEVSVTAGTTAAGAVSYTLASEAAFNLRVDGMHITQGSQTYRGSVPLVSGRDGYLRVFVKASSSNQSAPQVRVRFYNRGVLTTTMTIPSPGPSVPTQINEGTLASSWNLAVPSDLIQPEMSILADVDPENQVSEADEGDNHFPTSGTPVTLAVRTVPTLGIRFVPVRQSVNGLTGNVSTGNMETYLEFMRRIFPIRRYDAGVHATYITDAPELQSGNENGAWGTILSELNALRVAEGTSNHYYGVVKTRYSSGVAGIAYVGSATGVGWDRFRVGEVAAHELGHNFDRNHAPCGDPSNPDRRYPYAGGKIGVYGFDLRTASLIPTSRTDVMGYCASQWISDYTYVGVLDFLASATVTSAMTRQGIQRSLLVWGRISDGRPVLEPAFQVMTRPVLPEDPGPYRVDGLDTRGNALFSISFAADPVADQLGADERQFAFAIPLSASVEEELTALRLSGIAGETIVRPARRPTAAGQGAEPLAAVAPAIGPPGQVAVRWDGGMHPMVMVRDARTGAILSFARSGLATVWTDGEELELVFSDGVRSRTDRVVVAGR